MNQVAWAADGVTFFVRLFTFSNFAKLNMDYNYIFDE